MSQLVVTHGGASGSIEKPQGVKPVARVAQGSFGRGNVFWYGDCPPEGTDLYLAPPPDLEAKVKEQKEQIDRFTLLVDKPVASGSGGNSGEMIRAINAYKAPPNLEEANKLLEAKIAELTAKCEEMREALVKIRPVVQVGSESFGANNMYISALKTLNEALEECK